MKKMTLLKLLPEKMAEQSKSPAYRLPLLIAALWIIGLILSPFVDDTFRSVEQTTHPVVIDVTIDRIEAVEGGSLFWGTFKKQRNCAFDRVDWWYTGDIEVRIPLDIREPPKSRSLGSFEYGPWWVPLSKDELLNKSKSSAVHICHSGWRTISPFWTPKK